METPDPDHNIDFVFAGKVVIKIGGRDPQSRRNLAHAQFFKTFFDDQFSSRI
jgi:hypothetical protein